MPDQHASSKKPVLFRWVDRASEAAGYLSGACLLLATLTICYAIALRSTGHSAIWQTELATYLLIFVTFIGGAYGLKHGSHVNVELLPNRLPEKGRAILRIIAGVLSLVLIVMVAWHSYEMWWEATVRGRTSGTAWNPPLSYPYAILPVGMVLIGLQYLAIIGRAVRDLKFSAGENNE